MALTLSCSELGPSEVGIVKTSESSESTSSPEEITQIDIGSLSTSKTRKSLSTHIKTTNVILLSLLFIRKYIICLINISEFLLCFLLLLWSGIVFIRVPFKSQFSKGFFNIRFSGLFVYSQYFIVVFDIIFFIDSFTLSDFSLQIK